MKDKDLKIMYREQFKATFEAIIDVMVEGSKTHEGEWKATTYIDDNLIHAEKHIETIMHRDSPLCEHDKEDIAHAATRCLMALTLFLDGRTL